MAKFASIREKMMVKIIRIWRSKKLLVIFGIAPACSIKMSNNWLICMTGFLHFWLIFLIFIAYRHSTDMSATHLPVEHLKTFKSVLGVSVLQVMIKHFFYHVIQLFVCKPITGVIYYVQRNSKMPKGIWRKKMRELPTPLGNFLLFLEIWKMYDMQQSFCFITM